MGRGLEHFVLAAILVGGLSVEDTLADPLSQTGSDAPVSTPPGQAGIVMPEALDIRPPAYPAGASGEAVVVLELTITREGTVSQATAASGEEPFISAALDAAPSWRFEPAKREGRPVGARILFEVRMRDPLFVEEGVLPVSEGSSRPGAVPRRPSKAVEVVVRGMLGPPKTSFSRAEVRAIPGTFGDPFRVVEIVPGVAPIASGLPYFFVRGAPPGNVGYFVDGIRVPLLYHLAVGPSVLHPGLVESVELYTGGYPARHGRYAGGIVAARTLSPRAALHAEGSVRITDAGALVEAPLDEGRGGALVSGRYSYAEPLIRLFAPEVSLGYFDYQHRSHYDVTSSDTLSLFALGSYDRLVSRDGGFDVRFATQFHRLDFRWDHRTGASTRLRTAVTLGLDRTETDYAQVAELVRAEDRSVGARLELEHRIGPRSDLHAGADTTIDRLRVRTTPAGETGGEEQGTGADDLELHLPNRSAVVTGAWAEVVWSPIPDVQVAPGFRVDAFHALGRTALSADPRVAVRFDVSERVTLEHSLGVAHQPASFTLPIPAFELTDLQGGLQKGVLSSASVEWRPGTDWSAKLGFFQNAFFDLTDALSLARYEDALDGPVRYTDRALGHAYGLEVLVRRSLTRRVGGYLAYTLSRSVRSFDRVHRTASFDRTHVGHAVLALSPGAGIRLGTRLTAYSGLPATLRRGVYLGPDAGGVAPSDPLPPARRGPPFFRLDLRFEKKWQVGSSGAWVAAVAEVVNANLSTEVLETVCDIRQCEQETFGPITIPSVGVEFAL